MASNQMSRRDNTTEEREARLPEKDRFPKMASHFEHLAEKVSESAATTGAGHFESLSDKKPGETVTLAKFEVTVGAEAVPGSQGQGTRLSAQGQQDQNLVQGTRLSSQGQEGHALGQGTRLSSQGQQDQFLQGTRLPAQGKPDQNLGQGTRLSEKDQNFVVRGHGAPTDQHDLGMSRLAKESHAGQGQQFGAPAKGAMFHGARGREDRGTVSLGAQSSQEQARKLGDQFNETMSHGTQGHGQGQGQGQGQQARGSVTHGAQGQAQQFGGQSQGQGQQFSSHGHGPMSTTMSHGGQGHGAQEQELRKREDWEKHSGDEIGKHGETQQKDTTMPPLTTVENLYARAKQPQEYDTNKISSLQEKNQFQTGMTNEEEEEEEDMEDALEEMEMEGEEGFALRDKVVSAAAPVKDTVVSAAQKTKETVVPVAKTAAEYAGKAKDTAVVAGWSTAQLTAAAAVEGTKLAAKAVQGVAGYVAPVAVTVGQKGAEIAARSFHSATDAALSTGETAKEYAARKKEEARREMEAKRLERGLEEEGDEFQMETPENEEWEAQYATLGQDQGQGQQRGGLGGVQRASEWEAQPHGGAKGYAGPGQGHPRGGSEWEAQQGAKGYAGPGQGHPRGGSEWEAQRGVKDYAGHEGLHRGSSGQGPPGGGLGGSESEGAKYYPGLVQGQQRGGEVEGDSEREARRAPTQRRREGGVQGGSEWEDHQKNAIDSGWEAQQGAKGYAGPGQGHPRGGLEWEARQGAKRYAGTGQGKPSGGSQWEVQHGAKDYAEHEGLHMRSSGQGPPRGGLGGSESEGAKYYPGLVEGQQRGGEVEWEAQRPPTQHMREGGVQGASEWETHQNAIDSGWEAQQGAKVSKDSSWEVLEPTIGEQAEEITGGVLHAIGETIAEIAQTTKYLVIGHDDPNEQERFKTETGEARQHYEKNIQDRRNVGGPQY